MKNLIFCLSLLWTVSVSAAPQLVDKKSLSFAVESDALEKGEIHYAYQVMSPAILLKQWPELAKMDSFRLLMQAKAGIEVTKATYLLKSAPGNFTEEHLGTTKSMQKFLALPVTRLSEKIYNLPTKGRLEIFFDSDDISSIQDSNIAQTVDQSKKLDTISSSSFSTMVIRGVDMVQVSNHIPVASNKTLVVSYQIKNLNSKESLTDLRSRTLKTLEERAQARVTKRDAGAENAY